MTVLKIFEESNIEQYLNTELSKTQCLQNGFEELLRYHDKLPFTIFRKLVPHAISYRRFKRNPLKRTEIERLIDVLLRLQIDMKAELSAIVLDETVPIITVPPAELVRRLADHPLVDEVATEPFELFKNGHFNESVRRASERFEHKVSTESGLLDIGVSLMSKSFNLSAPMISINPLATENEKGAQEGFMFMTMGMIRGIRNIFSHGDEEAIEPEQCYEMLLFINWLFKQLPIK